MASPDLIDKYPVDLLIEEDVPGVFDEEDKPKLGELNEKFSCHLCTKKISLENKNIVTQALFGSLSKNKIWHHVFCLSCPEHENLKIVAFYLCEKWWTVEDVLKTADKNRKGILEITSCGERLVLYVLNQIIFKEQENSIDEEFQFLAHSPKECAKLLWENGKAIGFYTLKEKGTLCCNYLPQFWEMTILDTIFIKKEERRKGFGLKMLENFIQSYPGQELGFSYPISPSLEKVCSKFLYENKVDQERLWICKAPGNIQNKFSLWFHLSKRKKH